MEVIIFNKKKILFKNQKLKKKKHYPQVRMTSDFPSATLTAKRKHGNVSIFSVLWVRVYDPHSSFKKNYLKMFSPEQSE